MSGRTWARLVRACPVQVTTNGPNGIETLPTQMRAHWSEENPAAVILAINDPWNGGQAVEWIVGRNLLVGAHLPGMAGDRVGRGDVQVRYDGGLTTMWLRGGCTITLYPEALIELLRDAARIVPLGGTTESAIYDAELDADLLALTGGAV